MGHVKINRIRVLADSLARDAARSVTAPGENCEICGKPPSPYPNWIVGRGHRYHIGCVTEAYDTLCQAVKYMLESAADSLGFVGDETVAKLQTLTRIGEFLTRKP